MPTAPDSPTGDASVAFETPDLGQFTTDIGKAKPVAGAPAVAWTKRARGMDSPTEGVKRANVCLHPDAPLTPLQRDVLESFIARLEDPDASVVVTNPRLPDNPIVYVTKRWQGMCGYTYNEAVGRNPRLTQGKSTNLDAVRTIKDALTKQSACKVQIVNYRGGEQRYPFWNMLSINPIVHSGELLLYAASLQDYSYHMDKLVSLTPSQFCRTLEHYQRGRHIGTPLTALQLAKPTVYEANAEYPLAMPTGAAHLSSTTTPRPIKRLGWSRLALEPEHLRDRVADVLQTMGINYDLSARSDCEGEICSISAAVDGITMRVMIAENPADGCYT